MVQPVPGYRTILDITVSNPSVVRRPHNRAADARARNLGLPAYFGQY